jgi:hypothetical protein
MTSLDRGEILAAVRERADSDPAFRALLLEQPSVAMSEIIGIPVPDSVRISVHEESPTDIHLVIPAAGNLDNADLELVSGSGSWVWASCASGCE